MASTDGHLLFLNEPDGDDDGQNDYINFDVIYETDYYIQVDENQLFVEVEPDSDEEGEVDDEDLSGAFAHMGKGASDIYIEHFNEELFYNDLGVVILNPPEKYPIVTPSPNACRFYFGKNYYYLFYSLAEDFEKTLIAAEDENCIKFEAVRDHFAEFPIIRTSRLASQPVLEMVERMLSWQDISLALDNYNSYPNSGLVRYPPVDEIHSIRAELFKFVLDLADGIREGNKELSTEEFYIYYQRFRLRLEKKFIDKSKIVSVMTDDLIPAILMLSYFESSTLSTDSMSHDMTLPILHLHAGNLEAALKVNPALRKKLFNQTEKK